MLLHTYHAVLQGFKNITIRTVDTDVLVLAVSIIPKIDVQELWVEFGVGKNTRFILAHDIAMSFELQNSKALSMFHVFTGCDKVSSFTGIGMKTAWETWKTYDAVTNAFLELSKCPTDVSNDTR